MARAIIRAGACGFTTSVHASSEDMQNVTFEIETDCEKIKKLAEGLGSVDAYSELALGNQGAIHSAGTGCCVGCIVPSGISKVMQVAASLMLPSGCSIEIES
ncbi:MAG: DUF6951 family protein [Armatimonadota bacterium]